MPSGVNVERRHEDFTYPELTRRMRFRSFLSRAGTKVGIQAATYIEGIDESKYQYSATKRLNHAAALAGGVAWTVIRVSNCITPDERFEQAWTDAMAAGMPIMVYANVQGYKSGTEQANFAMELIQPFIKACKTKVVLYGDFEADGLTLSIPARQKLATDFLNRVHTHYETGLYSNWKYWVEMYGNMKPPAWAWLWGAHWTSAIKGTFPSSWDLSMLVAWQYGIWDNYPWVLPVSGNSPDIDKNRWMWAGGNVSTFLKPDVPEPPPPSNVLQRLIELEQGQRALSDTLSALEEKHDLEIAQVNARIDHC